MATVSLDVLMPEVRTYLNDVPENLVLIYLQRAAKQFCQDSGVWEVSMGTKDVTVPVDGDAEVEYSVPSTGDDTDFALPEESYLSAISKVKLGEDYLEEYEFRYDLVTQKLVIAPRVITTNAVLEVFGTLEPTKAAQSLPAFLVERWSEGIVDYAIHEMMNMPERTWSAPYLADDYWKKYVSRVSEASVAKAREGTK